MLNSVLSMDKSQVSYIMTPRSEIYSISINDSIEEVDAKVLAKPYSQIPVFDDKYDTILGILKPADFMRSLRNNPLEKSQDNTYKLEKMLIPPYVIPEGASLKSVLPKFNDEGSKVGIIVNEYGQIIGITTLQDIIEHIVGDIKDSNGLGKNQSALKTY